VAGDTIPGFGDIILPRINLVQNVGALKDSFQPGAVVYNQTQTLYTPPVINQKTSTIEKAGTPPLILTVLGFRPTRFVEKVPGGGRGALVNTEEQVRLAGGTLDYNEWKLKAKDGMKRFEYLAEALISIERPELAADDDTVFVYEVGGKKLALGLWAMKGSAYTAAAKRVFFTARSLGCLRSGYPSHSFALATRQQPTPDKSSTYWAPVCVPAEKSTPEFLAWAAGVLQAPTQDAPDTGE
jgi:hypothetical protein